MSTPIDLQLRGYTEFFETQMRVVDLDEIMERHHSEERVRPIGATTRPQNFRPRRGWPVAVAVAAAAAAAVLVLVGGMGLLFNLTGSDSPAATNLTEPLSPFVRSRVPQDGAVSGGEGSQEILSVTRGGSGLVAVAVGSDGGGGPWARNSDSDAAVWTSPDGIAWSRVTHDETVFGGEHSQVMSSVIVGGPGLVAVGWDGQGILDDIPDVDAAIWTSVGGDTWSRVPHDEDVFGGAWIESVTLGAPVWSQWGGPKVITQTGMQWCGPLWTGLHGPECLTMRQFSAERAAKRSMM
jgi:hypothetical protein